MSRSRSTIAALAFAVMSLGAQAASVTSAFNNVMERGEINQSGELDLFDSTLGTLTGATLTIRAEANIAFTGDNGDGSPQVAEITSDTSVDWASNLAEVHVLMPSREDFTLRHRTFGPLTETWSHSIDLGNLLGALQSAGGGTFGVRCSTLSSLNVRGSGDIGTAQGTLASCSAEIVYAYTAHAPARNTDIPEPLSLALFGSGLAALAFSLRRQNGGK